MGRRLCHSFFFQIMGMRPGDGRHKILIEYYALRDPEGEYLGCLEATQDITEIQEIKGEKRLLD